MNEENQKVDELGEKMSKPPEAPPNEPSASAEREGVKMPDMEFSQTKSKQKDTPEAQDVSQANPGSETAGTGEEKTDEAKISESAGDIASGSAEGAGRAQSEQAAGPDVERPEFEQLRAEDKDDSQSIDMLLDVTLPISIELGRANMAIEDILNLGPGSVVELDRLAGEPVDLLVNDKLLAKGEVVVIDENFGVRITNMVSPQERIKSLK